MLSMSHTRRWFVVTRLFIVTAVLALPMTVYAQESRGQWHGAPIRPAAYCPA